MGGNPPLRAGRQPYPPEVRVMARLFQVANASSQTPCLKPVGTVGLGPIGRASRLPALILGARDQGWRVREHGLGVSIGPEGPGKGPEAPTPYVFH